MKKSALWITLILIFTACSSTAAPAGEITPSKPVIQEKQTTAAATPTPSEAASPAACVGDASPQQIDFTASDGQTLSGYFYPACSSGAPVVVLMHWIQGDETDWSEIAVWLQNRGQENPFQNPGSEDWWDPSWFPKIDPSVSYNVFIFSFRGCEHYNTGCRVRNNAGWLLDTQAAMQEAGKLAGVDPTRIAAIGSSIGADGAADSCLWLNHENPGTCRGVLSLSPGSFLGVSYPDTIRQLGESTEPVQAWCFADENEIATCNSAAKLNANLKVNLISNGGHGNNLLTRNVQPSVMQSILDFLSTTFAQ